MLNKNVGLTWQTPLGEFEITTEAIEWMAANSYKSMYDDTRTYIYNKAFYEAFLAKPTHNNVEIFDLIRQWAKEKGILDKGDPKTQLIKLYEETGELSQSLLNNDKEGIIDAIGDSVVVLTNLAELNGVSIETCMQFAYDEISGRTGRMVNGTFVKD
jgi:NTP pyrophosphatase (non-canonical NTP hydrolase)